MAGREEVTLSVPITQRTVGPTDSLPSAFFPFTFWAQKVRFRNIFPEAGSPAAAHFVTLCDYKSRSR